MKKSFLLLLALVGFSMADAKIVLPQMFQSGMVLQRGKPIPVWGKADPQEQVTIRWQKKQYTTTADNQLAHRPAKDEGWWPVCIRGER